MAKRRLSSPFSTINPHAAGIDIGATHHVVAVGADRDAMPVRTFRTFSGDLHALADWLQAVGITTVAMESTGVYWIPVFEILEARGLEVVLVNARDVKQVPGRKTDVNDAQWLQQLHQHGLLRGSFRPREAVVQLRAYLRLRERLVEYAAAHIQHMQKALMQMNLAAAPRSHRHHRGHRNAHPARDCRRRALPGGAGDPPRRALCRLRRDAAGGPDGALSARACLRAAAGARAVRCPSRHDRRVRHTDRNRAPGAGSRACGARDAAPGATACEGPQ